MGKVDVADIRNVAFCGHGSSGKTTLVDKILVKTGAVNAHASVDDGTSICDFDHEEKHHKYTIESTLAHCAYQGKTLNLIDTPGYPDFIGQTIGALSAVDFAIIAVNAHSGIEVNTRRVFREAEKAGVGRMIVMTRMDTDNIDFPGLISSIQELWGPQCVLLNVPVGLGADFKGVISTLTPPSDTAGAVLDPNEIHEPLIESIIEVDEAMMERYFEGQPPSNDELSKLIVQAVRSGALVPIVCCSSKLDIGVDELLDAIVMCAPSPLDVPRTAEHDGQSVELIPAADQPLAARVFKTRVDPFVQKLSYIRIFSGALKKDQHIAASTSRKGLKIGQLLSVQADHNEPIEEAGPGQIVAVAKIEELKTDATLGECKLPPIPFPTPMVGLAVSPKTPRR